MNDMRDRVDELEVMVDGLQKSVAAMANVIVKLLAENHAFTHAIAGTILDLERGHKLVIPGHFKNIIESVETILEEEEQDNASRVLNTWRTLEAIVGKS